MVIAYLCVILDIKLLRNQYHITGKLVGCHPRAPRQNSILVAPMYLTKDEVTLLLEKGVLISVTPLSAPLCSYFCPISPTHLSSTSPLSPFVYHISLPPLSTLPLLYITSLPLLSLTSPHLSPSSLNILNCLPSSPPFPLHLSPHPLLSLSTVHPTCCQSEPYQRSSL